MGSTRLQGTSTLLLGTLTVTFTNNTYHGQPGCSAAGALSDDHLSALGIMVFKLSTCSVLNICLISGSVKPLETSFLQQWQVSGAVPVMFSQGNITEAGGWRSDIQPIPMLEGGFTCVYAVQTSVHLKECILDYQRDYAISSNNYTSAQLMSDLNLSCCKIRQFLHILFPMIQ